MPQKRMERLRTTKSPNLSMILSWPSLFPVTLTGRSEINAGKNVTDMMNETTTPHSFLGHVCPHSYIDYGEAL